MNKITSVSNELIKNIAKLSQKKYREETGLFLAEGEKAISGLINTGFELDSIITTEEKFKTNYKNGYTVTDAIMSKVSTTKTPCSMLAVFKQKKYEISLFFKMGKILLLENIKDAGNLGTILRSCKAFNIEGVILLGNTIDLYNPKVIRASVGCFDLPVIKIDYEDLNKFKNHHFYSTALKEDSVPLSDAQFLKPFIISFGAEADGLSKDFLKIKSSNVNIEMNNSVESLNLASAVSIILYELYKKF